MTFTSDNARVIGSRGGKATATRHGSEYMAKIGRRGAEALHKKYSIQPVSFGLYLLVNRRTNKIKACLNGNRYLKELKQEVCQ